MEVKLSLLVVVIALGIAEATVAQSGCPCDEEKLYCYITTNDLKSVISTPSVIANWTKFDWVLATDRRLCLGAQYGMTGYANHCLRFIDKEKDLCSEKSVCTCVQEGNKATYKWMFNELARSHYSCLLSWRALCQRNSNYLKTIPSYYCESLNVPQTGDFTTTGTCPSEDQSPR